MNRNSKAFKVLAVLMTVTLAVPALGTSAALGTESSARTAQETVPESRGGGWIFLLRVLLLQKFLTNA